MATRATQIVSKSGTTPTSYTPAASDKHTPGSILRVSNASGGSVNVTIDTQATIDGNAIADIVVAVGAGAVKYIDIPTNSIYQDPADGLVPVLFSATASVSCEVVART